MYLWVEQRLKCVRMLMLGSRMGVQEFFILS
jgi:hypothetical protein